MEYKFDFSNKVSIKDFYAPAMEMTDPDMAKAYLEALITYHMDKYTQTREEATAIQHSNLGYYAGYYSHETQERVERLFGSVHPLFGSIASLSSREKAFEIGLEAGKNARKDND